MSYRSVKVTNGQCCHMSVLEIFMNDVQTDLTLMRRRLPVMFLSQHTLSNAGSKIDSYSQLPYYVNSFSNICVRIPTIPKFCTIRSWCSTE